MIAYVARLVHCEDDDGGDDGNVDDYDDNNNDDDCVEKVIESMGRKIQMTKLFERKMRWFSE